MRLDVDKDEALALRNCILPRLVEIEQHGYQEEFDGEALALRRTGDKLETHIAGWADRTQAGARDPWPQPQ